MLHPQVMVLRLDVLLFNPGALDAPGEQFRLPLCDDAQLASDRVLLAQEPTQL